MLIEFLSGHLITCLPKDKSMTISVEKHKQQLKLYYDHFRTQDNVHIREVNLYSKSQSTGGKCKPLFCLND